MSKMIEKFLSCKFCGKNKDLGKFRCNFGCFWDKSVIFRD